MLQTLANTFFFSTFAPEINHGALAHLARARHWQCRGDEFESHTLHTFTADYLIASGFYFIISPYPVIRLYQDGPYLLQIRGH